MPYVSFRQARIFLATCSHSSITGAAQAINRSQTSVTKSLQEIESELGVALFDRTSRGVTPTAYGRALERGAVLAAEAMSSAGELVPPVLVQESPGLSRFFQMDVSDRWLNSFLAVADWQSLSSAAQHLGVTKSAVSSNIRKLEDMLSATLFERLPSASIPTRFSRQLIRYIKLARSYMRHAVDEVLSMQGEETGQISIGSLPFVRTLIIPRAIARLRQAHPNFDVSTLEGPYDDLVSALRCGDIDLLVGALRGPNLEPGLEEDPIMTDELSVIVRVGHPLQNVEPLTWSMLLDYEWILPRVGTPTRSLFETALRKQKMQCPEHVVETSSMVLLRGLLLEGDQLTVLSRHQIIREEESSMLAVLPFKLHNTYRPIGITSRSGSNMAPAAKLLVEQIRAVVMDLT